MILIRHPFFLLLLFYGTAMNAFGDQKRSTEDRSLEFKNKIKPFLTSYCYDCHAEGSAKGQVSLDDPNKGAHHLNQSLIHI